jgi:hypothetical protein
VTRRWRRAGANQTPSLLAATPEKASSYVQCVAWLTQTRLHCLDVSLRPADVSKGWAAMTAGRRAVELPCSSLRGASERVLGLAMEQWHVLLLVAPHGGEGGTARVIVVSRISATVVRTCHACAQ